MRLSSFNRRVSCMFLGYCNAEESFLAGQESVHFSRIECWEVIFNFWKKRGSQAGERERMCMCTKACDPARKQTIVPFFWCCKCRLNRTYLADPSTEGLSNDRSNDYHLLRSFSHAFFFYFLYFTNNKPGYKLRIMVSRNWKQCGSSVQS